jgi:hypothetical protein
MAFASSSVHHSIILHNPRPRGIAPIQDGRSDKDPCIVLHDFGCCHTAGSSSSLCSDAKLSAGAIRTYRCSNPPNWGSKTRRILTKYSIRSAIQNSRHQRPPKYCVLRWCFPGWEPGYDNYFNRGDQFFRRRDHRSRCTSRFCGLDKKGHRGNRAQVSGLEA